MALREIATGQIDDSILDEPVEAAPPRPRPEPTQEYDI